MGNIRISKIIWLKMIFESVPEKTFLIAEAGVNHNGSLETAIRLCEMAKISGANAIKFQTWVTENIVIKGAPQAIYQEQNTNKIRDQFSLLKELELSFDKFEKIYNFCKSIDLEFLSTPDDLDSLNFLVNKIGLQTIKIGSGEITNIPFLREIGKISEKIIMSTGMCEMKDIEYAIRALGNPEKDRLVILHCTSSYPCPYEYVNLDVINTFKKKFEYEIGYSDHTLGTTVAIGAVALGASVIEKHFTLNKNMYGPDHSTSLEPEEFRKMSDQIRIIEKSKGNVIKNIQEIEKDSRKKVTKMIVAKNPIKKGSILDESNVSLLRTGNYGLNGQDWDHLMGKRSRRSYKRNELIDKNELN